MTIRVWIAGLERFFLLGIKSYTDESTNAASDTLQILTGVSISPSKLSYLTSQPLRERRAIVLKGQAIKCSCILWHSSPGFYIKNSYE